MPIQKGIILAGGSGTHPLTTDVEGLASPLKKTAYGQYLLELLKER